ncbi:MAG: putative 4-mercaptohistidine N1-methyltransferase [Opitutales bacterium]
MSQDLYETDELLRQYLIFHYAGAMEQFPWDCGGADGLDFPRRCVSEGVDPAIIPDGARALDLGCAVGRSSFELARMCPEVIGVDFSRAFIDAANQLKKEGRQTVLRQDEGDRSTPLEVRAPPGIDRERVVFEQGDVQALRGDLGQFDVVLACNLVCRLPQPARFLGHLHELVKPGGQLFVTTPFSWLEAWTPRENWLGGTDKDSFTAMREALEPEFALLCSWDMPFLIREHARKFQYTVAQASRWLRADS